jgi:hypothetical protein
MWMWVPERRAWGGVKQYPWVVDLDVGMRRKLTFTDIGRLVNGLTKSLYQG